jgi:hypothetical protein
MKMEGHFTTKLYNFFGENISTDSEEFQRLKDTLFTIYNNFVWTPKWEFEYFATKELIESFRKQAHSKRINKNINREIINQFLEIFYICLESKYPGQYVYLTLDEGLTRCIMKK